MYTIKEFDKKYNKQVNEFIISIFVDEYGFEECRRELEEQDNYAYIKNGGNFWIAVNENDDVVGTMALRKHNDEEMELKKLYVRSDYRGKGLSKELYSKAMDVSKDKKIQRIFLGTYNKLETAENFYKRRGFELYDEKDDAIYFELYI